VTDDAKPRSRCQHYNLQTVYVKCGERYKIQAVCTRCKKIIPLRGGDVVLLRPPTTQPPKVRGLTAKLVFFDDVQAVLNANE
jgi:hypothetical protein